MTLNQIVKRIKSLALAHKQVRDFRRGLVTDFFADQTAKYPAVLVQDQGGAISFAAKATSLSVRLYFADLVHVSEDTGDNELDVQSDMVSIAEDILAEMNMGVFDDWAISQDNPLTLFYEGENDLQAGCYVDLTIRTRYTQNVCQIPTDALPSAITEPDMKVYDLTYNASAAEGSTLVIPALAGKKILVITRENNIIYRASNLPGTTEYAFDGTSVGLGTPIGQNGERFLILWRNY
jgi:hypothetical protein